ncbi:hypothetical protein CRG98_001185 [Punica granatum]|uniref:Uncharacterized protein n=1 Tax=Punica granatum TaxID=22663 RepID=A0A2I0LCL3_PUNGR|nr:hypothetical protein CRG98_001185 [Punica granatum]
MAYVEGDLDWMCESRLDITRELDRSDGFTLDPGDSTAFDQRVVNSKWRLFLKRVRHASSGRWTLPSRVA